MSVAARRREFDALAASVGVDGETACALFDMVDSILAQTTLRHAIVDPNLTAASRSSLVHRVFDGKTHSVAVEFVAEAARWEWPTSRALVDEISRQGVLGLLREAQRLGKLDAVRDELFRFGRVVYSSHDLMRALDDRHALVAARETLVRDLVGDRVSATVARLALRALRDPQRSYVAMIQDYLDLASGLRDRQRATVRTAIALTPEQRAAIQVQLTRIYGREMDLDVTIDPQVLGGVAITVGDEIIDGSVARKLETAQQGLR